MLNFPKWQKYIAIIICICAIIFSIPNFTKHSKYSLNLGLDLKGGSQLLLRVDFESYLKEQTDILLNDIRSKLIEKKIGYAKIRLDDNKINFILRNIDQKDDLSKVLKNISDSINFDINQNIVNISYSQNFLIDMRNIVMEQSIEIVRRRIDETGMIEPSIQKQGDRYILLQVPGLDNPESLKQILGKTARLSFHMLDDRMQSKNILSSDLKLLHSERGDGRDYVIKKQPLLNGESITSARTIITENNKPAVNFNLNHDGGKKFADITTKNIGKALAIVLDEKIISVATISEPIRGGSSIISGNFSIESANELSLLLRAGALPAPIYIEEERIVGPSLGSDSIESGKIAALYSFIMIFIFMIITYGIFGLFANVALIMNMFLIISCLSILQATLTMPGIAGMILTMGMAVDANVLIFERIREELKSSSLMVAVDKGFKFAFSTIIDSNITTLIVAILLYIFGSGAIKGFAITLTIGILTSMFSAITLTKMMIFDWIRLIKPNKKLL